MGYTANVVDGQIILAAWGNEIRDRSIQVFATAAERDAQWAAPPNGAMCVTLDTSTVWQRIGGAWAGPPPPTIVYRHYDESAVESGDITSGTYTAQTGTKTFLAGHLYELFGKIGVITRAAGNNVTVGMIDVASGPSVLNNSIQIAVTGIQINLVVMGYWRPAANVTGNMRFGLYTAAGPPIHYFLNTAWPHEFVVIDRGPVAVGT